MKDDKKKLFVLELNETQLVAVLSSLSFVQDKFESEENYNLDSKAMSTVDFLNLTQKTIEAQTHQKAPVSPDLLLTLWN